MDVRQPLEVEVLQLVSGPLGDGAIGDVELADRLDLPAVLVVGPIPLGVPVMPVHRAVLGVNVEFDAPTRCSHSEIQVAGSGFTEIDLDLLLDRNAATDKGITKAHLGVGVGNAVVELDETRTERRGSPPCRVAEPLAGEPIRVSTGPYRARRYSGAVQYSDGRAGVATR